MMRLAGSLAVFAAVATLVPVAVFRGVEALEIREVEVALDAIDAVDAGLAGLDARETDDAEWQVGVLGDSMLISYPPGRTVPARLQQVLDELGGGAPRVRVHSLATPGMGPFDYYFVSDRVAAAAPDEVILPVNLTVFSNGWRETFARPELAGFLPPSRLPEAFTLPLEWIGVTADRTLSYVAVVKSGGADRWQALMTEQARLGAAHDRIRLDLSARFAADVQAAFARDSYRYHRDRTVIPKTKRLTPIGVEERFGRALAGVEPDDPSLQLLAAAIRVFRSHAVEVLVYTNPTNVEHIEAVGAANAAGLARTLASIEAVSDGAGARFVDLHALVLDAGFRDFAGHLSVRGDVDGPLRLARRLAPLLAESAQRAEVGRR